MIFYADTHGCAGDALASKELQALLPAKLDFYQAYNWFLDPRPTIGEAIDPLHAEIQRLGVAPDGWQTSAVVTNGFLLSWETN